jgi:hypothetical protein
LLKGSVVHPVDLSHFYDTEVKYSTSCSNRSELFSLLIDFNCLFSSFDKLFIDFFRSVLDSSEYINNIWVIKKRSLDICKSLKKIIFIILEHLCVHGDFLLEGCNLIFKMFLFL